MISDDTRDLVAKLREELEALEDAINQNNRIQALVEISSFYGVLKSTAEGLGTSMGELRIMHDHTDTVSDTKTAKDEAEELVKNLENPFPRNPFPYDFTSNKFKPYYDTKPYYPIEMGEERMPENPTIIDYDLFPTAGGTVIPKGKVGDEG